MIAEKSIFTGKEQDLKTSIADAVMMLIESSRGTDNKQMKQFA